MARGRMLNNKISASKQFDDLPDDTCRLLATWTIAHLDVRGVFYGDPALVKSYVFPRRADVSIDDVARYLQAMAGTCDGDGVPLIILFEARGETWQYWPQFAANQVGLRADRETSDFPIPPDYGAPTADRIPDADEPDDGARRHDSGDLPEDSRHDSGDLPAEEKLREGEGKGRESKGKGKAPPPAAGADRTGSPAMTAWLQARNGVVGPLEAELLWDLVDGCEKHRLGLPRGSPGADVAGDEWLTEAIQEAVRCNTRSRITMKFVEAIARRWMAEGYKAPMQGRGGNDGTRNKGSSKGSSFTPRAARPEEFYTADELAEFGAGDGT